MKATRSAPRENSKKLLDSKPLCGTLDAAGKHLKGWLCSQSCWVGVAGCLLNRSQASSRVSAANERAEDPTGAPVRRSCAHTLSLLQPPRAAAGCWKVLLSWGCPEKGGKEENMRLCCLTLQAHLPVPPATCKVRMTPRALERCKEATTACSCHELFGQQVPSNTIHLLHGLKLLHNISLYSTFNSAFWCVSIKEWNPKRDSKGGQGQWVRLVVNKTKLQQAPGKPRSNFMAENMKYNFHFC